jgi:hypothetical protein
MEQVIRNRVPRTAIIVCLTMGLSLVPPLSRLSGEPLEYQVKAAFLLNFTKFIEWPAAAFETPDSPIAICVLGDDPFGSALDQIVAGEVVNGRRVAAQRFNHIPAPKACKVIFVGTSEKDIARLLPELGIGVLTVGEGTSFTRAGGMIAFVIENRRVRFEINRTAAENAGLKLSSKLLTVAKLVER